MFERFTERARQVVTLAQEEARALKHSHIGTEHLLLGLLREEETVAAKALSGLGVDLDSTRERIALALGDGGDVAPEGQIPFTPRTKKVLEGALREALSFGHNYIGTEHILLALAREHDGVAAFVFSERGVPLEEVRAAVAERMTGRVGTRERAAAADLTTPAERELLRATTLLRGAAEDDNHLSRLLGEFQDRLSGRILLRLQPEAFDPSRDD